MMEPERRASRPHVIPMSFEVPLRVNTFKLTMLLREFS